MIHTLLMTSSPCVLTGKAAFVIGSIILASIPGFRRPMDLKFRHSSFVIILDIDPASVEPYP